MMRIYKHLIRSPEELNTFNSQIDWSKIKTMWGVAPVAPLHIGYDSLIILQKEILKRNPHRHFMILADMHSMLSHKFSWKDVRQRCYYYEYYFREMCELKKADIILGSYFQTRSDYIEELYSCLSSFTQSRVRESLPKNKNPNDPVYASIYAYPIMQCIDAFHVRANCIIADEGQKKIYDLIDNFENVKIIRSGVEEKFKCSNDELHFIYIPASHDIRGLPLNLSNSSTRISIHDSKAMLERKINSMYCPPGKEFEAGKVNALLETFRYSIFPWFATGANVKKENGQYENYTNYSNFEQDYFELRIHPTNIKITLKEMLWNRLSNLHHHLKVGIDSWIDFKKLGIDDPRERKNNY